MGLVYWIEYGLYGDKYGKECFTGMGIIYRNALQCFRLILFGTRYGILLRNHCYLSNLAG